MAEKKVRKKASKPASAKATSGSWQSQKSDLTRRKILDATLECLVDIGYAKTTAWSIAEKAEVSRGAMTHHFPSQRDVIKAAASYLHDKRIEEFRQLFAPLSHPESLELTLEDFEKSIERVGKYLHMPSFTAFTELMLAARTDKELEKIMAPVIRATEQDISEVVMSVFPAWKGNEATLQLLQDLVFFCLQGIAINSSRISPRARVKALYAFLASEAKQTYDMARQNA